MKQLTYEELTHLEKTIHNNVLSSGTWDPVDPKDANTIALHTQENDIRYSAL